MRKKEKSRHMIANSENETDKDDGNDQNYFEEQRTTKDQETRQW